MKTTTICAALFLCLFTSMPASAQYAAGNVNVLLGQRTLNADDWSPVEKQLSLSAEGDYTPEGWPVGLMLGVASSQQEDKVHVLGSESIDVKGSVFEVYAGARKYFNLGGGFTPYLNAGASLAQAEVSASIGNYTGSGKDSSLGVFAGGGLLMRLGPFNVGVDGRFLVGTSIEIGGVKANADYAQASLVIGYGW